MTTAARPRARDDDDRHGDAAAGEEATRCRPAIIVTGAGAYDPEGDKSENGGDARLATDGNAKTAWKTEHYRSTFRKSGVGLVLDAGKPVKASRVVVTTETPGYAAQVQVGNSPTGPFSPVSGSKTTTRAYDLRAEAPTRRATW